MPGTRLMLLDSASLYFRAFYGVPSSVRAPDGTPINAVRGLLDFISRLVADHQPTDLIAAWDDDWRPQFRVDAIPSYKAHRVAELSDTDLSGESVPDELLPQVDLIEQVLALIGICRFGVPGYEADDVIASLATQSAHPTFIVTGDRDLFQLIDDDRPIRVLYTAAKGVGNAEMIDDAAVRARYGVTAAQYADYALLRGDASDGLPGVRGIGEKTASALISEFGSVPALISAVQSGGSGVKAAAQRNLLDSLDYVYAAGPVVRVVRDIPLPDLASRLPAAPAKPEELTEFAQRWGLTGAIGRLATALGWSQP